MNVFKLIRRLDELGVIHLRLSLVRVEENCLAGTFVYLGNRFCIDVFEDSVYLSCTQLPNQIFVEVDSIKELIKILKEI